MTRTNTFLLTLILLLGSAFAQRTATLEGVIDAEDALPEGTRLGVQLLDAEGAWRFEIATVVPVAGTFATTLDGVPEEALRPLRGGAVLLPGLQNEYRIEPDGAHFAHGSVSLYVDRERTGTWSRSPRRDAYFLALAQLEQPIGFFTLIYVDQPVRLIAPTAELELEHGWNIFSVRFPESGPEYAISDRIADIALEVLDLIDR